MKKRAYKGLCMVAIVFLVNLLAGNMPLVRNLYAPGFIDKELLSQNIVAGSYHTMLEYGVVALFVFSFFISYVMEKKQIVILTRYKSRSVYYRRRIFWAGGFCVMFALVHELESIFFLLYYGDVRALVAHQWIEGILFQIIAMALYYIQYYLIYELLNIKYTKSAAQSFSVGIFIAEYFLARYFITNHWFSVYDVELLLGLCLGNITIAECWLAVFRLLVLDFLLYQLLVKCGQREDWLKA